MHKILLGAALLALAGCDASSTRSPVDGKEVYPPPTAFSVQGPECRYMEWNGHRYVAFGYGGHGSITHDPDCPYDKKPKPKPSP